MNKARKLFLLRMIKFLIVFALSYAIWIVLTFEFNVQALLTGVVFSVIISAFSVPFFYQKDNIILFRFLYRIDLVLFYILIVVVENYISSFEIIKLMLTKKYKPGIVRIKTNLRSNIGKAILANTISLIPGTLSLWMDDNKIYVHCFDLKTTHSIKAGKQIKNRIENLLARTFG